MTIDIVEAHRLITTTMTPIVDIAEAAGCSVLALEKRLERAYGKRSRELRTGAFPTPGRTPADSSLMRAIVRYAWRSNATAKLAAHATAGQNSKNVRTNLLALFERLAYVRTAWNTAWRAITPDRCADMCGDSSAC